ncbi:hypothetical protein D3C73_1260590 [compost metagenome]
MPVSDSDTRAANEFAGSVNQVVNLRSSAERDLEQRRIRWEGSMQVANSDGISNGGQLNRIQWADMLVNFKYTEIYRVDVAANFFVILVCAGRLNLVYRVARRCNDTLGAN